ncbi:MAG: D-aminoacylase [FCB group bacterium]|nr:D-aminoacylase [FCB group bacterium]
MTDKMNRRTFIKTTSLATAGVLAGCSLHQRFDVLIRNGLVYDGSGTAPQHLDLGLVRDKIVALGHFPDATADLILNADGRAVSPGFIDIHTHTDVELLANPKGESKIRQGVTTEVSGNCGSSPFPLTPAGVDDLDAYYLRRYGIHVTWEILRDFFHRLERSSLGINYATFTGQGDLRAAVVGQNDIPPTPDQLNAMRRLLAESMEQGSLGLSTGLEYAPGSYAKTDELIALCDVVGQYGGIYATHMRNEDDRVEEAIEEALTISRRSGVPLEISHLKACNKANWDKVDRILENLEPICRNEPVAADRYPYDAWGTGLSSFIPLWARQGDTDEVLKRLNSPMYRQKILDYAQSRAERIGGWDRVWISSCSREQNKKCEGKSIQAIAREDHQTPKEVVERLLIEERTRVGVVGFAMSEDNLKKVLAASFVMIGSDGNAVAPYGVLGSGKPHPRFYGTFPRVLGKYVREEGVLSLEEAIKKMTSMPAEKLGLTDRGRIAIGKKADLVIFNADTIRDKATYSDPHQYPVGIETVLVNGKMTIHQGEHTGTLAGEVLRHKG